ncbi:ParB-like protein [Pararhizobium sp. DWP3-4]|uniref:ParB-like protein n=1 Tax=Pararhizobium sp. DWP3-4 TaxID=2804565 RepID=UPI003CF25ABC
MTQTYEPHLQPVAIASLRPTQMTVGFREVACKSLEWREISGHDGADFLGRHMVPVVIGWKKHAYLIDHHHLVRALQEEGVAHVLTSVVADLSDLGKTEFWSVMDHYRWSYPFDAAGERQPHNSLPKSVAGLIDDPYRSLAGALRGAGGYAKDNTPFSEFMWADFLRNRIDAKLLRRDFKDAEIAALKLARTKSARHLPGWCGPSD